MPRLASLLALVFLAGPLRAEEPHFRFDWNAARQQAAAAPAPAAALLPGQPFFRSLAGQHKTPWWRRLFTTLSDYQIGDEWGKKPVTAASAAAGGAVFARAAKATAAYGGATAFYLGKYAGHHLVATNHHVSGSRCNGSARFPLLGRSFPCRQVYGDWKDVDFALFSVDVPPGDEPLLAPLARGLAFDAAIYPGQKLLTIGFGVANNRSRAMVANQDADCVVFSRRGEFRLLADPDEINPGDYAAWSFANGCDVSHGDSGSAFLDRETGDVLGLVWTGKFPKAPETGSSARLAALIGSDDPAVWSELTLSVPAAKIGERLRAELASLPAGDRAATLSAVLGR
jgi:hypothetical protein